jgi:hypothetical protein
MFIWAKAKSLFDEPNAIDRDPKLSMFAACAGWFKHFK